MSIRRVVTTGVRWQVKGLAALRYRAQARRYWQMDTSGFWRDQLAAFRRMYEFARARVPYYRDRPAEYPPLPGAEDDVLALLASLPIINKQTVRQHGNAFHPSSPLPFTTYHTTSGTTGTPVRLSATLWERAHRRAVLEDWISRICGTRKPRTLLLTGFMTPLMHSKDLYWRDPLSRRVYLSIFNLNETNRGAVIELFHRYRPQLIAGYPSAAYQLALLVGDALTASKHERVAELTAEVLQPHWREVIEASLCKKVYDQYGSQEGCHWVVECDHQRRHIHPSRGVLEIVDEHLNPVPTGGVGRVLVTGLLRRSMPLLRYEIGDAAESTGYASGCPCGVGWPTIGPVHGRAEDLVKTRDGRRVGLIGHMVLKHIQGKGIKEAQICQKGYERFSVLIVVGKSHEFDREHVEQAIREGLARRLQLAVTVEFEYANAIPRGPNGKFKALIVDF